MTAGAALSRALIKTMPLDEFDERHDEIMRWTRAGAKDGEPAPPLDRPEGHVFTRSEVAGMSTDDFDRHHDRIFAQMRGGGIS